LIGGLAADGRARVEDMLLHVVFKDLAHETVERPARRSDALQDVAAFDFVRQRALDGVDLTADAPDAMEEFGFLANGVTHGNVDSSREPRISYPGMGGVDNPRL
jgi:hypothetical protein